MKNKKRIASYTVYVFIAAMALLLVSGKDAATAKADSLTGKATITINYEEQVLTVTGMDKDDRDIMVSFPTVTTDRDGDITKITEKEWDFYQIPKADEQNPIPKVTADISVLNPVKTGYILIKSTKYSDAILVCIDPVVSKVKAVYDAESKGVDFFAGEDDFSRDEFQYRTAYGTWKDYDDEVALDMYEQQGVTLYFRFMPGNAEKIVNPKSNGIEYGVAGKTYLQYNAVNTFAGKEIKVKVTKLKTAPKVSKVDLDNQAYVLKAGTEYRFAANADGDWTPVDETTVVSLMDELDVEDWYYPGQFEIRYQCKDASEKKKYVAVSKTGVYEYPALRTVMLKEVSSQTGNAMVQYIPIDPDLGNAELKFQKVTDKKGTVTGVEIENVSSKDYQIVVSVAEQVSPDAIASDSRFKPKTVKAGAKLKLSNTATTCPEGSYIYVRYASDKKKSQWASSYVSLGKLTYE